MISFQDGSQRKYFFLLLFIFFVEFLFLAIKPYDRHDWALENVLALLFIAVLFFTSKKFPLSRKSYTFVFIFLCIHEIGAHYTYAEVPYDVWFERAFGRTFNSLVGWERNNFDRVVHFLYGFLLAYPLKELCLKVSGKNNFWVYFLPVTFIMASSMTFELFEWGAAEFFGGDLGVAYLGTQGDVWDAHKDMALASLGSFLCMALCFCWRRAQNK